MKVKNLALDLTVVRDQDPDDPLVPLLDVEDADGHVRVPVRLDAPALVHDRLVAHGTHADHAVLALVAALEGTDLDPTGLIPGVGAIPTRHGDRTVLVLELLRTTQFRRPGTFLPPGMFFLPSRHRTGLFPKFQLRINRIYVE